MVKCRSDPRYSMAVSTILFEDIFDVKDIDQDGKKFERGMYISWWLTLGQATLISLLLCSFSPLL